MYKSIAVIGSSGAIGNEIVNKLAIKYPNAIINAFSRTTSTIEYKNVYCHKINYLDEQSIAKATSNNTLYDLIFITNGVLHESNIKPEKSINDITANKLQRIFLINTIIPALLAKYFLPKMEKDKPAIFSILSARVGSISDNRLGGWYSYRASKAALNMIIKNLAIEMQRKYKKLIIVGLHPGTVDSNLSKPFQNNIPKNKVFNPSDAVEKLIFVINNLSIEDTGKCFAWNGQEILP